MDAINEFDFEGENHMATAIQSVPTPQPLLVQSAITAKPAPWPVPLKAGAFGPQGSGKSSTAALIAVAISVLYCNRAPVFVVDPEAAWPFLKRRIFDVEGVELITRPYRSFKQMQASIREAEKLGCCAWVNDPLTVHWNELMDTFKGTKGFIAIDDWGDIRQVWGTYIQEFLNSKMTCIATGRLGNDFEEQEETLRNGQQKTKLVKVGTKFKAGGGESFGYEPHLLFEMSLERKARRVKGQEHEGEGRMVHRVDVLKDRTWALNGMTLRIPDRPGYQKGGFRYTFDPIKPHFNEVQATLAQAVVGTDTSESLIVGDTGKSEYYRNQERKDILRAELHATIEALWGGSTQVAKDMRRKVLEHVFGWKSKEAADAQPLDKIERGVRIMQAFEKRCKADDKIMGSSDENILANLDVDIREFDEGVAEEMEMPF
jgi:hypothetical protein